MRTNIVLNDELINEALKMSDNIKTKKDTKKSPEDSELLYSSLFINALDESNPRISECHPKPLFSNQFSHPGVDTGAQRSSSLLL